MTDNRCTYYNRALVILQHRSMDHAALELNRTTATITDSWKKACRAAIHASVAVTKFEKELLFKGINDSALRKRGANSVIYRKLFKAALVSLDQEKQTSKERDREILRQRLLKYKFQLQELTTTGDRLYDCSKKINLPVQRVGSFLFHAIQNGHLTVTFNEEIIDETLQQQLEDLTK